MELNQLINLRNMNVELLENTIHILHQVDNYCKNHSIPLPMDDSLMCLVQNAIKLIEEINEEVTLPSNFHTDFLRRKVTEDKSDEDVPVP